MMVSRRRLSRDWPAQQTGSFQHPVPDQFPTRFLSRTRTATSRCMRLGSVNWLLTLKAYPSGMGNESASRYSSRKRTRARSTYASPSNALTCASAASGSRKACIQSFATAEAMRNSTASSSADETIWPSAFSAPWASIVGNATFIQFRGCINDRINNVADIVSIRLVEAVFKVSRRFDHRFADRSLCLHCRLQLTSTYVSTWDSTPCTNRSSSAPGKRPVASSWINSGPCLSSGVDRAAGAVRTVPLA